MTSEIVIGEKVVAATVGSMNPKHIRYVVQAVRPMGSRQIAKIVLEARDIRYRKAGGIEYVMDMGIEDTLEVHRFDKLHRLESKAVQGAMKECAAKWAQDYAYLWA